MNIYEILAGGAKGPQSFMMLFEVTAPDEDVAWEMVQSYGHQNQLGELAQLQIKNPGQAPEGSGPRVKQLTGRGFLDFE